MIAGEYNDIVIYPDKVRLNCYYYRHYSFVRDIQMIFCMVLGRKMGYAGGGDMIIDNDLLDQVSAQAKASPRLRMRSTYGRFACQRTIISTSRWRISVIGC